MGLLNGKRSQMSHKWIKSNRKSLYYDIPPSFRIALLNNRKRFNVACKYFTWKSYVYLNLPLTPLGLHVAKTACVYWERGFIATWLLTPCTWDRIKTWEEHFIFVTRILSDVSDEILNCAQNSTVLEVARKASNERKATHMSTITSSALFVNLFKSGDTKTRW